MMTSYFNLLKYAATGIASPDMTYYDKMRASTLMGGAVKTLTGIPPLSFPSDGSPLISWSMKGNGQQTGTPTHDNPVMPTFCGARTGNLFDMSDFSLLQVTSTAYRYGTNIGVLPQGTYTFNATKSVGAQSIYLTAKLNGTYSQTTISSVPFTFSADGESEYIIRNANNTGTTWEAEKYSDMMLNSGSTALPYEPYGWAEKITCAGQTTSVYLGQTQTVRRVKKLVLTGEETWTAEGGSASSQYFRYLFDTEKTSITGTGVCSHFEYGIISSATMQDNIFGINYWRYAPTGNCIYMRHKTAADVDAFKTWLAAQYSAGNPVTVWYVLAEPTTGIINEPLAKISEYADELHSEDAGVTIPTVKGSNTLTVETELQPIEMSITYRG